ncbi:hypothetical protein [Cycloclasticus sp.]|uniref:hypothetical protein n=1 Tax=Cycloclasticus sp. TaxID=2024830 RepID=UPI0025794544|nr:hypothetical protein [Cycloclasticus sp.]
MEPSFVQSLVLVIIKRIFIYDNQAADSLQMSKVPLLKGRFCLSTYVRIEHFIA